MHRSLLHSFLAICAAAALLLQHAPLGWAGHGEHVHCNHAAGHYCTKEVCVCGKKHHSTARLHGTPAEHTPHVHAPGGIQGATEHHPADDATGHASAHDHGSSVAGGGHTDVVADSGTAIEPCDSDPSGILTLTLDKFVPRSHVGASQANHEAPRTASYIGLRDQLVITQIFHPPLSTI